MTSRPFETLLTPFKRLALLSGETEIHLLGRLSERLGGPRIWIKRDDINPLLGGNKLRKLEFLLADALACGADCVLSVGALQSNHARLTASAAIRAGLTCHVVLKDTVMWPAAAYNRTGNRLLETLMACSVEIAREDETLPGALDRKRRELEASGHRPYVIPFGGSNAIGNLGYVECAFEIQRQQSRMNTAFSHVFVGSGSAGTQAGLLAGKLLSGWDARIVGVNVLHGRASQESLVREQTQATCQLLAAASVDVDAAIHCDDAHYLPGYGWPNDSVREAIELCAQLEALLLDPVYTGKAMAGLIRWIREGRLGRDDDVLFIHTGGLPGLFAYEDYFTERRAHTEIERRFLHRARL